MATNRDAKAHISTLARRVRVHQDESMANGILRAIVNEARPILSIDCRTGEATQELRDLCMSAVTGNEVPQATACPDDVPEPASIRELEMHLWMKRIAEELDARNELLDYTKGGRNAIEFVARFLRAWADDVILPTLECPMPTIDEMRTAITALADAAQQGTARVVQALAAQFVRDQALAALFSLDALAKEASSDEC